MCMCMCMCMYICMYVCVSECACMCVCVCVCVCVCLCVCMYVFLACECSGVTLQLFVESQWPAKLANFFALPALTDTPLPDSRPSVSTNSTRQDWIQCYLLCDALTVDYNPAHHPSRLVLALERASVCTNIVAVRFQ
jgi:hypothetical protein